METLVVSIFGSQPQERQVKTTPEKIWFRWINLIYNEEQVCLSVCPGITLTFLYATPSNFTCNLILTPLYQACVSKQQQWVSTAQWLGCWAHKLQVEELTLACSVPFFFIWTLWRGWSGLSITSNYMLSQYSHKVGMCVLIGSCKHNDDTEHTLVTQSQHMGVSILYGTQT